MSQSKSTPTGEQASAQYTAPVMNIFDTAIDAGNLTTLAAGLKAAGLSDILSRKGPFTVFAPTDEAFKKLPAGAYDSLLRDSSKLKAILNYHVVSGYFMARDLKSGEVATAQGTSLTMAVTSSDVRVNEARVAK